MGSRREITPCRRLDRDSAIEGLGLGSSRCADRGMLAEGDKYCSLRSQHHDPLRTARNNFSKSEQTVNDSAIEGRVWNPSVRLGLGSSRCSDRGMLAEGDEPPPYGQA